MADVITTVLGYGCYTDDRGRTRVACPRAKSNMTPCVANYGAVCVADDGRCVACGKDPWHLLRHLQMRLERKVDLPRRTLLDDPFKVGEQSADQLRALVLEATEDA